MVSQTDVVKALLDNKAAFGPSLHATVEQLELDDGACMTGEPSTSTCRSQHGST